MSLRGDIAYRGASAAGPVWKKDVRVFTTHVTRLIGKTELEVGAFLEKQTGTHFH